MKVLNDNMEPHKYSIKFMAKKELWFKYPKFYLLILTFFLAYILFTQRIFLPLRLSLIALDYTGIFLTGMLYSYSFTASTATAALLLLAKEHEILITGILAGFGALISDLLIFKFIRTTFQDEIKKLSNEKFIFYINRKIPGFLRKSIVPIIAAILIASPLPDEIGVSLFAAATKISINKFSIISYTLNTAGIFIILLIGKAI